MALDDGTVLVLITVIVAPIAAVSFARSGGLWSGIGGGAFGIDHDPQRRRAGGAPPPVDPALQAAEARQMIEAKSYRRQRRGEPALDVEAELSAALAAEDAPAPELDDELREEVRRLVIAGNERRRRRGEPELDVHAETERQMREISRIG